MTRPVRLATLGAVVPLATALWVTGLHGQSVPGGSGRPPGPTVGALLPDTVLTPPSGPRIVRLPAPGSPVVALRLSIPVREGPAEAGAGRILQMLGLERAVDLARPMGATVEGTRTPWSIAYTVTGAASDVDFLAFLLREAVKDPAGRGVDFRQAVGVLEGEAERRQETPGGRVAFRLRAAVAPAVPPPGGTAGSLARLAMADLRSVWARTHQAPRMTLVVAGDVPVEVLLASFQALGASPAAGDAAPPQGAVSEPSPPPIQVLRHWYGEARVIESGRDPHAEVAALLVADRLQSDGGDFEAEVQLWQLPDARVLTIVGAAYSSGRQAMRRTVQTILTGTAEGVTSAQVERAVARLRADLLMQARSPAGRAGLVGLHLDATGQVAAARDFLGSLDAITPESVRDYLSALAEAAPETAEVRP